MRWSLGHRAGLHLLWGLLATLLLLRLYALGNHVLFDTTEARYGEVARLMLASGNWVTPQNELGVPFWAKPPLYAWAGAASMAVFGVNEFAVRLPSLLFSLGTLFIVFQWARAWRQDARAAQGTTGEDEPHLQAWAAVAMLASMVLFFISAGAIMTEASLLTCTTGMLACFWFAVVRGHSAHPTNSSSPALARLGSPAGWAWGFFAFAGLGLLAKGPVAWVYAGLPIVAWMVWQGAWKATWQNLPWFRGAALTLLICAPWYLAAEAATPGYLEYFLVGEHFYRFTQPGWSGDKYGNAHIEARGTIWLFFLASALPWALWGIWKSADWMKQGLSAKVPRLDGNQKFLLCAVVAPLLFFTIARNIIWTYTLPALPALALLLCQAMSRSRVFLPTLALGTLALGAYFLFVMPPLAHERSSAQTVFDWQDASREQPGTLVFVNKEKPPHSAKFYSRAQAKAVASPELAAAIEPDQRVYFALENAGGREASPNPALGPVRLIRSRGGYSLFVRDPAATPAP
jgi:4-amino-4-deoxy-L-arabinose transferase-like glycosyltransferase